MKEPLVRFSVAIGGELLDRFDRYREERRYPNRSEAVRGLMRAALIEDAVALVGPRGRIGLMATFAPTLASMPPEFAAVAPEATLVPCLAEGALAALNAGDGAGHDAAAVRAASGLQGCDVIALAQFSLSQAAGSVAAATGKTVLTTPDSAVRKLRRLLLPAMAA